MTPAEHINIERLWSNLMELAEIGAIEGGGLTAKPLHLRNLLHVIYA